MNQVFNFIFVLNKGKSPMKESNEGALYKYNCPVYRNSIRAGNANDQSKNFVHAIELNCREDPEFWILRGLCMILQNDD